MNRTKLTYCVLACCFFFASSNHVCAQLPPIDTISVNWEKVPGIPGQANAFARVGSTVFAGTQTGLYSSSDNGENWQRHPGINHEPVLNIWSIHDTLFLQQYNRVYQANSYLVNEQHDIYRSTDGGNSFMVVGSYAYTNSYSTQGSIQWTVGKMGVDGDFFYASVDYYYSGGQGGAGIVHMTWHSFDRGENWAVHTHAMGEPMPNSFASKGDTLVGFTENGFLFYVGNDLSQFTQSALPAAISYYTIWSKNGSGFIGAQPYNDKIIRTQDFQNFDSDSIGFDNPYFFKAVENAYYIGSNEGIFRSETAFPFDFHPLNLAGYVVPEYVATLLQALDETAGSEILLSLDDGYSFRSTDSGASWQKKDKGLGTPYPLAYYGSYEGLPWITWNSKIYRTTDGERWEMYSPEPGEAVPAMPIAEYPDFWLSGDGKRSFDNGQTWQPTGGGFTLSEAKYVRDGGRIFAFDQLAGFVLLSNDWGETWEQKPPDWVQSKRDVFVWGDTIAAIGINSAAVSFDAGESWETTISFPDNYFVNATFEDGRLRVLRSSGNLFISDDKGATWTLQTTFSLWNDISFFNFRHYLVGKWWMVAVNGTWPLFSADDGSTWVYAPGASPNLFGAIDFYQISQTQVLGIYPWIQGGHLYILSPAAGVWRTSLNSLDEQWSLAINAMDSVFAYATICEGESYAYDGEMLTTSGVYTAVFQNQNGADSIVTLTLTVHPTDSVALLLELCESEASPVTGTVYDMAGEFSEQAVLQNQYGCDSTVTATVTVHPEELLVADNGPLPYGTVYHGVILTQDTQFVFYDTTQYGCLLTISENVLVSPSATNEEWNALGFKVSPNPTSNEFIVEFALPKAKHVYIQLLDLLGRLVVDIAEGELHSQGKHTFRVDTKNWPDGMYTIRIQADDGISVFKKIIKN